MVITELSSREREVIREKVQNQLEDLQGCHLLVVGDVGLDEYVIGEVRRISPEAPVPVVDVIKQERRLGLAANVAQNIVSLKGQVSLVGVIGEDEAGQQLFRLLEEGLVSYEGLVKDPSRPTTRKTRILAEHHHVVRVDQEKRDYLDSEIEGFLFQEIQQQLPSCKGVLLEDYGKGLFSREVTQRIIEICHQSNKQVIVDPHRTTPLEYYRGADVIKPNRDEALILSGVIGDELRDGPDTLVKVAETLLNKSQIKNLVMTLGKDGMLVFDGHRAVRIPTYAQEVYDVTGAGDTVLATIGMSWFSGWSLVESCVLANMAAGVVVQHVGCVPCKWEELKHFLDKYGDKV
ncbi:MAG: D-glycero-beta-D-manno-heptose-7-phosphate kinase [Bdellovibrio sp.]|nr:MAG: D-glycero-beta-D-manno-heptose-7-phosphate kinase [Bdellovibrio sp.]